MALPDDRRTPRSIGLLQPKSSSSMAAYRQHPYPFRAGLILSYGCMVPSITHLNPFCPALSCMTLGEKEATRALWVRDDSVSTCVWHTAEQKR